MTEERLPEREQILQAPRAALPDLRARYHVRSLSLYGSYRRGEQNETSDVDVLVEFDQLPGLFGFVRLENELSELLGVPVDLATRAALKPPLRSLILAEATPVMTFFSTAWVRL